MPPEDKRDEDEWEEEEHRKVDKRASRQTPAEDEAAEKGTEGAEAAEPAEEAEPEAAAAGTAEAGMPEEQEEAPDEEGAEEGPPPEITVYGLLRMSIGMYAEQAWIHMGVRMDPSKQKTEQNLPLAKVAVDTVAFLVEQLGPDLTPEEKRELDQLVANLRINYVQRS